VTYHTDMAFPINAVFPTAF
jgi:hypothetical protein